MANTSRRQFLKASLAAGLASLPALSLAQQSRVSTVAGTGVAGYEFEGTGGAPATETPVNNPYGVVIGPDGALYFCEVDSGRVRRLDLESRRLSTVAGNGEKGFVTESRQPLETPFSAPHEIRWDEQGNLYIVERDGHCVHRIAKTSGLVTTLAGNGEPGFSGDGGIAVLSQLRQPHSIAFDSRGNLLICDIGNQRLRSVNRDSGFIDTLSGTGERVATPDSGPLNGTPLLGPRSVDCDPDGNAYLVLREGNAVFQLDIEGNRLQRIAGTGEQGYSGDGGSATSATFNGPKGIAYSRQDHCLYIVDTENHVIRRMALTTGLIDTVLGTGERGDGPDGDPLGCKTNRPHGVCVHEGIVYVSDSESHRVRAISGLMG
ncbi:MAG: twin-arginine translocation signal domain-containing protein [Proteobacteria bacterium]|nr:twin-arginine translocation signal domain-containing protein [Pseudomonadota bacterium]